MSKVDDSPRAASPPVAASPDGDDEQRGFYRRHATAIHTVATFLLGIVAWEVAASQASSLVMVPLADIGAAFVDAVAGGELLRDFVSSFQGFFAGLVLASVAGIAIGVVMATSKIAFDFLDPWVSALYSTPLIALAPLFIIVFGIGMSAKIAVVVSLAVFPVIINTAAGIRTTDRDLLETARSFGASRRQIYTKIYLPSAVPFIVTGLRLAVGRALIGVVVAEFFGSRSGLGHRVFAASQNFDTAAVWLGVFVLAAIGIALIRLMYAFERWVAPWRTSAEP